jgi:hypothetical protein
MSKGEVVMTPKTDPNTMPDMQPTTEQQAPFNPTNLRLSQSFVETAGVKKLLTTIPVRKPSGQEFVRVQSDPAYRENFPIIELRDEREEYIVVADLVPLLIGEFVTKTFVHSHQSPGHRVLLAGSPALSRWEKSRLVAVKPRGRRVGDEVLDQSAREYEPWRL